MRFCSTAGEPFRAGPCPTDGSRFVYAPPRGSQGGAEVSGRFRPVRAESLDDGNLLVDSAVNDELADGACDVAGFIGNANVVPIEVATVTDGRATGRLGEATVSGVAVGDVRPGPATMMVRLERIRMRGAAGGGGVPATVRQKIFSGSAIQYVVGIDGSPTEFTVEEPHTGTETPHAPGDTVRLYWEAGDVRICGG